MELNNACNSYQSIFYKTTKIHINDILQFQRIFVRAIVTNNMFEDGGNTGPSLMCTALRFRDALSVQRPRFALRKVQIASERPNCFGLLVNWVLVLVQHLAREARAARMEPERKIKERGEGEQRSEETR